MTLKKDTRRDLGKRLVNRELAVWEENGWIIDSNRRWVWTRGGMRQITVTDYFGRYDFLAAWPKRGIIAMVQVSAASESEHESPLGMMKPLHLNNPADDPEDLLKAPKSRLPWLSGVYEVYVYYRKLKSARGAWVPDRRWWKCKQTSPDDPPEITPTSRGGED